MSRMISYMEKDTAIHRLSGFTKLLFFMIWCITGALTYDTRVLAVMLVMGAVIDNDRLKNRVETGFCGF